MRREKRVGTTTSAHARRPMPVRMAVMCCALAVAGGVLGCGDGDQLTSGGQSAAEAQPSDDGVSVGSVGLALVIGDAHLDTFNYVIVGGQQFQKTGAIDVSNSTQLSAPIGGIPFGTGYTLTLNATSAAPVSTCSGSADFQIIDTAPTPVPVHIRCKRQDDAVAQAVPIPPVASATMFLLLLGLGVLMQRVYGRKGDAAPRGSA